MRSATTSVTMEQELRAAVAGEALTLRYQPQVDLAARRIVALEALLRWQHPVLGQVAPAVFIPLAETLGLLDPIFRWVLQTACRDAAAWPEEIRIGVNISAIQLTNRQLPDLVAEVLRQSGMPPARLELEITESARMPADVTGAANLLAIRGTGVQVAIDDFGAGHSTLLRLMTFPADKIKIDRCLISSLPEATDGAIGRTGAAVLRAVISLATRLGLACTAEGVETEAQMEFLVEAGCREMQGYLFSPPVTAGDVPDTLSRLTQHLQALPQRFQNRPSGVSFFQIACAANDIIIVTTPDLISPGPIIVYVNEAFTRLTGFTAAESIGSSPRMLQGPGTNRRTLDSIKAALQQGQPVHEKILNYSKTGAPYWLDIRIVPLRDDFGTLTHFAAIERDVTMDKRRADELAEVADRDTLTGIPNRLALLRAIGAEIEAARTAPATAWPCIIFIDVDQFKSVNDRYGHAVGDIVLCGIADRLAANIRRSDMVGRIGGEEFVVCVAGVGLRDVKRLAESLKTAIAAAPFETPVGPLRVTASFGVTGFIPGDTTASMLERADAAMYDAKRAGGNRLRARLPEALDQG